MNTETAATTNDALSVITESKADPIAFERAITYLGCLVHASNPQQRFREKFYAERCFLKAHGSHVYHFNGYHCGVPKFAQSDNDAVCIPITMENPYTEKLETLSFWYFDGKHSAAGKGHGLAIVDEDDNLLYLRSAGEDEFSEWEHNEMDDVFEALMQSNQQRLVYTPKDQSVPA